MSRLTQIQARFQQKQMQEKEEKLVRLYENQQQRTMDRLNKNSAGSTTSNMSNMTSISATSTIGSQKGKVRQMFDERRQKAGIDRSYPLEPLNKGKTNRSNFKSKSTTNTTVPTNRTVVKKTVQNSTVRETRNGKPVINRSEMVKSLYTNNNGVENYQERHYQNGNGDNRNRSLEQMMNNHHLGDTIDNESFPDDDLVDYNYEPIVHRLPNVGGKLPSQIKAMQEKTHGIVNATPIKTELKPIIKKSLTTPPARTTLPNRSTISSPPSKSAPEMQRAPATKTSQFGSARTKNVRGPPIGVVRDDLNECKYCGRRFAEDRLALHEEICARTGKKKRKVYDATKHRVEGTEMAGFVRKGKTGGSSVSKQAGGKKSNWRATHQEFIDAIRSAKTAQAHLAKGGKLSDLPPPPPSTNPDYVQCPHCNRKFNESAAERHIPKCANYEFNKPKPRAGASRSLR